MVATLTFMGAAGTVTGSKFLLESDSRRTMVDCGLYQGEAAWRRLNWQPLPVSADSISDVILTHAHLDHCGHLPALVREGFSGPTWGTPGTAALAAIVLRDSAHIQEEDAEYARLMLCGYLVWADLAPLSAHAWQPAPRGATCTTRSQQGRFPTRITKWINASGARPRNAPAHLHCRGHETNRQRNTDQVGGR